ncbi:polysaccharide biosynthesis tyrosine autokinase [Cellulomonas sp.]|uniref:polysaccharide biosynthesis tyrosine autokinase n=1 Tax=Cellulomonas sp. TaxID=40001 RepID=UPI001B1ACBD6|nr:polysaccharide biosynthesis tyrosine autokinase [Cellulomonas sp.]MBO9556766.1 polysaccharide biosynthesis tyrosine autokinase [Cellulomonas sp.]
MELSDYLSILKKRWLTISALGVAGVVIAVGASLLTTPMYTASTQLYVSVQGGTSTNDLLQGSNFTRQQVASYTSIVTSPLVLGPVIDDLGLGLRAGSLAERVSATSPSDSSLVNIEVLDESPAVAAALADTIAEEFRSVVADLDRPTDGSPSTVKLTVVRNAAAPTVPSVPNTKLNLALGLLLGVAIGVGIAIVREMLDTVVRSAAAVRQLTDVSVVGVIGLDDHASERPLIVQDAPHSARAESFRRLRTNIQFLNLASRPSSIVVTSSLPGEGKSTTTINLAIALADAGSKVALVDADLRRPSIAKYLGIEGGVGLTTVLIGQATVEDVVQPWGNGLLRVVPSGQVPPNPSELLGSDAMTAVLDELVRDHDVVLIDTPPLLPVTDAAVLAKYVGGVLLVVGAGKTHRQQLAEAIHSLDRVEANTLGVVVNREPQSRSSAYVYYEYSQQAGDGSAGARRTRGARTELASAATPAVARPGFPPRDGSSLEAVDVPAASVSMPIGSEVDEGLGRASTPPQHVRGPR